MKLDEYEVFSILKSRYDTFIRSGAWSSSKAPYDADAHNAVIHALKEFVDTFSQGRLEVVVKEKTDES